MKEPKPWDHPKYDVMNLANNDLVLASIAKLYKSEMLLAVAEVERLRAENARLKAEVERLTKAGDDLAQQYYQMNKRHPEHWSNAYAYWFAAKEGEGHE
jgi:FtsZ-binding cell division protein ZapB